MAVDIKKPNTAITEKFKRTKSELEALFDVPPPIHHVGSTAVPGVNGKNILDILISANYHQHMNHIKAKLLAAGYFPSRKPSTRPDYLFLASHMEETVEGDTHIHIAIAGTETHDDFLTLRDYLRSHKDEAVRYSAVKYTYANQAKFDRNTYKQLKSAYVDELLKRAKSRSDIRSSFVYGGQTIIANWYTVTEKDQIPDLPWEQVYAIGDLDGQVPLVTSLTGEKEFNLPGGHTESNETIEQTIARELVEECNMRLLAWQPLGYQHLIEPSGREVYQFRVYAELEKIGEFIRDPGGGVVKNTLVDLERVNAMIDYGKIGDRMIELARPYFNFD